jgi:hypothetical protein
MPDPQVMIKRGRLDVLEMLGPDAPKPSVTTQEGLSATTIRNAGKGMAADAGAELPLPRALTWAELLRAEPALTRLVPWLAGLPEPKVSPLLYALYRAKWEEANARMLEGLPAEPAAEFYDLAGAWELPATGDRPAALLLHGFFRPRPASQPGAALSGPLGNPTDIPFNPRTAYRWKDNSLTPKEDQLKTVLRIQTELKREYAVTGLPRLRNRQLEAALAQREAELTDLPKWDYLDSANVPFFSLPLLFRQYPDYPFSPALGDVAVTLKGGKIAPAVYGDELSAPRLGEFSEALRADLGAETGAFTVILFKGTAPAEPEETSREKLRAAAGKFVPLPEPVVATPTGEVAP